MNKIRNEYIRGAAQVGRFEEKTREARLRWFGHVRRKDDGYIGRRMLRMELPGKRKRGRPKRRFMDAVREDMAEIEVMEEDAEVRNTWKLEIRSGPLATPNGRSKKKKSNPFLHDRRGSERYSLKPTSFTPRNQHDISPG